MTRLTHVLGRNVTQNTVWPEISLRLVNLHRDENISEEYLLKVNRKGQVPTLTGGNLSTPLTSSLDISFWLCNYFPELLPDAYRSKIHTLLSELHKIQGLSLSVPPGTDCIDTLPCPAVDAMLTRGCINEHYRKALVDKRNLYVHYNTQASALRPENIAMAKTQAQALFAEVLRARPHLDGCNDSWIFGRPTLLDAHLVPFITRLEDCGHLDLVPAELQACAAAVRRCPEWDEVTHGRSTMWDISVGHVHELDDF